MKKVKYLTLLFAASMFAACSDSLDDNRTENGGTTLTTGDGYVKVAINLPTTSGMSRVNDGNMLDDGLEEEYAVENGIIAFFKTTTSGNPDASATFVKAYDLGTLTQQDDQSDAQVSTRVTTTTEAPLVGTGEQLYALVILNPTDAVASVEATTGTLKINGEALTSTSTLSALQAKLENQTLSNYSGTKFLMTNAPLSTVVGNSSALATTATAKTLVPVTVYETKAAAEADKDPAKIYVERVVAKVTLSGFTYNNSEYTKTATVSNTKPNGDDESVYNGDIIKLTGWALNVTNKSTKLVRDVTGFSGWLSTTDNNPARFVGTNAIAMSNNQSYYRIYWAVDGNYTKDTTIPASDFTTYTNANQPGTDSWNANAEHDQSSSPLYCFENTMDHSQQLQNRTTSVLLKTEYRVKFSDNDTPAARDFFICGTTPTKYPAADITEGSIKGIVSHVKETAFSGESSLDLQLNTNAAGGSYDSADDMKELFKIGESTDLTTEQAEAIWNTIGTIKYYKGGVSYYYATLIRHFNDSETPWDASAPTYALKHLGRYGVVRNNWYDINITSISGPGDPEITTPSEDPDDQAEGYVRAEINVLSWAKRSQNVDL